MIRVNAVTQFLVRLVEEREKNSTPNIYETFLAGASELGAAHKMTETALQELTEKFVNESLKESVTQLVSRIGMLLVEVKNQYDAETLGLGTPDLKKIAEIAAAVANEYEFAVGMCKAACEDADSEFIAERMIEAGKAAAEARKKEADK